MSSSSDQHPSGSTWTGPPWSGWIETTGDALLILEAARRGLIPRVTRRLVDSERKMITSGSVFVFDENESGIKRWTDGFFWSPSRILGNFLLYRETDRRGGHRNRADGPLSDTNETPDTPKPDGQSLSRPKTENVLGIDKLRERSLMGSLTNSYKFKSDGLMKKTFSLSINGVAQHLISYYKIEDVENGRLRSPSSLPELASLDISPEYLDKTHFRNPPKVEIGADGQPRYRGEADDIDTSPPIASRVPPLLTPGNAVENPNKSGSKRFGPYARPSRRRNTTSGDSPTPPEGGTPSTPTTSTLPGPSNYVEPSSAVTTVPPAMAPPPHYPHYGMPVYPYVHHPHYAPGPYPPPPPTGHPGQQPGTTLISAPPPPHHPHAPPGAHPQYTYAGYPAPIPLPPGSDPNQPPHPPPPHGQPYYPYYPHPGYGGYATGWAYPTAPPGYAPQPMPVPVHPQHQHQQQHPHVVQQPQQHIQHTQPLTPIAQTASGTAVSPNSPDDGEDQTGDESD